MMMGTKESLNETALKNILADLFNSSVANLKEFQKKLDEQNYDDIENMEMKIIINGAIIDEKLVREYLNESDRLRIELKPKLTSIDANTLRISILYIKREHVDHYENGGPLIASKFYKQKARGELIEAISRQVQKREILKTELQKALKVKIQKAIDKEKYMESNDPKNVSTKLRPQQKSSGPSSSRASPISVKTLSIPNYEYTKQARYTDDTSKQNSASKTLYDNKSNTDINIDSSVIVRKEDLNRKVIGIQETHTSFSSLKRKITSKASSSKQDQYTGAAIIPKKTVETKTIDLTSTHVNATLRKKLKANHNNQMNMKVVVEKKIVDHILEEVTDEDYKRKDIYKKEEKNECNEYSKNNEYNNIWFQRQSIELQLKKIEEAEKQNAVKAEIQRTKDTEKQRADEIISRKFKEVEMKRVKGVITQNHEETKLRKNIAVEKTETSYRHPKVNLVKNNGVFPVNFKKNNGYVENMGSRGKTFKGIETKSTEVIMKATTKGPTVEKKFNESNVPKNVSTKLRPQLKSSGSPSSSASPRVENSLVPSYEHKKQSKKTDDSSLLNNTSNILYDDENNKKINANFNVIIRKKKLNLEVIGNPKTHTCSSSPKQKTILKTRSSKQDQEKNVDIILNETIERKRTIVSTSTHPDYQTTRPISSHNTILNQHTFDDNNDGKTLIIPEVMLSTSEIPLHKLHQQSANNFIKQQDIKPIYDQKQNQNVITTEFEKQPPIKQEHKRPIDVENVENEESNSRNNTTSQNVGIINTPIKEVESQAKVTRRSLRLIGKNESGNKQINYAQLHSGKVQLSVYKKQLVESRNNTTSQNVGIINTPIKEVESQVKVTRRSHRIINKNESGNKQYCYAQLHSATSSLYKKQLEESRNKSTTQNVVNINTSIKVT